MRRAISPTPSDPIPASHITTVTTPAKRGKNDNATCLPPPPNAADHAPCRQRTGNHSGKKIGNISNATRLLTLTHAQMTTARIIEKFGTRATHPAPAIPAARFPARFPAMPRTCSHIAHARHTSARYQITEKRNSGKNGNEDSGNRSGHHSGKDSGKDSGNVARLIARDGLAISRKYRPPRLLLKRGKASGKISGTKTGNDSGNKNGDTFAARLLPSQGRGQRVRSAKKAATSLARILATHRHAALPYPSPRRGTLWRAAPSGAVQPPAPNVRQQFRQQFQHHHRASHGSKTRESAHFDMHITHTHPGNVSSKTDRHWPLPAAYPVAGIALTYPIRSIICMTTRRPVPPFQCGDRAT